MTQMQDFTDQLEEAHKLLAQAGYVPQGGATAHKKPGVRGFIMMKWVRLDRPENVVYSSLDQSSLFTFSQELPIQKGLSFRRLLQIFSRAAAVQKRPAAELTLDETLACVPDTLPGGRAPKVYSDLAQKIANDQKTSFFVMNTAPDHSAVELSAHYIERGTAGDSIGKQAKSFANGLRLKMTVNSAHARNPKVTLECEALLWAPKPTAKSAVYDLSTIVQEGFGLLEECRALRVAPTAGVLNPR